MKSRPYRIAISTYDAVLYVIAMCLFIYLFVWYFSNLSPHVVKTLAVNLPQPALSWPRLEGITITWIFRDSGDAVVLVVASLSSNSFGNSFAKPIFVI